MFAMTTILIGICCLMVFASLIFGFISGKYHERRQNHYNQLNGSGYAAVNANEDQV